MRVSSKTNSCDKEKEKKATHVDLKAGFAGTPDGREGEEIAGGPQEQRGAAALADGVQVGVLLSCLVVHVAKPDLRDHDSK